MAFPQGINFRTNNTAPYNTDGAHNDCFWTDNNGTPHAYPTSTPQGNTAGFEQSLPDSRNRNSSIDARLMGMGFAVNVQVDFRIDLPAPGNYKIGLAAGDYDNAQSNAIELFDGITSLGLLANGASAANKFRDATNTERTVAEWVASNEGGDESALVTKTFATTICRFRLVPQGSGINTCIVHVYVAAAGGGGGGGKPTYAYVQQ